jgi:hypothetical protein
MPHKTPATCKSNIDSLVAVRRYSKGKQREQDMVSEYTVLLKRFTLLCTDGRVSDSLWIDRIKVFLAHLNTFILPLTKLDNEFSDSVRRMMCYKNRCDNLPSWPEHLNRDFMNWICHKTAYVGYDLLGINYKATTGMGSPGSSQMESNVRSLVYQACQSAPKRGLRSRVTKANRAFSVAHTARCMRCNPDHPLCGETENRAHEYQRCLMLALYNATQSWLSQ